MQLGGRAYTGTTDRWIDDPVLGLMLSTNGTDSRPTLSDHQLYTLRSIAISAACMSMASGLLVGWWFVRMKRSFRHHLIMLMIFSDFFKASWQLIYPAVVFTRGEVLSESRFCQTSGFMMSMGIEASDFASLAIAVHSALYIFRPGMVRVGEGGLYRYRYYVYTAWLAFAIIMPSLAFLNPNPAYSAQGTFCYLPVRPTWFRLALAWIPRYFILLMIMILYASIYIYVRMKFRTFRAGVGASTLDVDTVDLAPPEQSSEPPRLPSLDSHGLIPSSPCPTAVDYLQPPNGPYLPRNGHNNQPFDRALLAPSNDRSQRASTSDSRSCDSRRGSFPTLFTSAVPSSAGDFGDRTSSDKRREMNEATANEEARRKRIAISRQLRLLFIYPIVYGLMWVPPLILHAMQFTDRYMQNPSFPLYCVVAFTLPFQCFVDCWLFTIREKPWRYIPETQGGNWYARYGFGFGKCKGKSAEIGAEEGGDAAWRNRKHMSFEAKKAYERRDAETLEAAEEWLRRDQPRSMTTARGERTWWDVEEQEIEEELAELEEDESDTTARVGTSLDDVPRLKIDGESDDGNIASNAA